MDMGSVYRQALGLPLKVAGFQRGILRMRRTAIESSAGWTGRSLSRYARNLSC